jgi:SAM-dependent methyltransferase
MAVLADHDDPEWRVLNRANWNERVGVHVRSKFYDLAGLRAGRGRLYAIEEAELGSVQGLRLLHLQCHFGADTLTLAQRGARVVGLDFSASAIAKARELAKELGLEDRAQFVEADIYDAPATPLERHSFDLVYATWGTLCWLPDVRRWAEVAAHFLKPGGALYLADGHPAVYVLDDAARTVDGMPGYYVPYFQREPLHLDDPRDYADASARLQSSKTVQWMHSLGDIVTAVIEARLRLEWLHEHEAVPWRMFQTLRTDAAGMFRWPEKSWLPLSFSLRARKPKTGAGD